MPDFHNHIAKGETVWIGENPLKFKLYDRVKIVSGISERYSNQIGFIQEIVKGHSPTHPYLVSFGPNDGVVCKEEHLELVK